MTRIENAQKKDLKEIAKLMIEELSKPPFNEKTNLKSVLKSLNFYFNIEKIFILREKGEIVGILEFITEQWWEGKVIIIEDLVIKNKYKSKGFGKLLMKKLEKYAKQKKLKSINFQTNKKAISVKFYEKLGYKVKKNTIFMRKEIR